MKRISGRVTWPDGQPVNGAKIKLTDDKANPIQVEGRLYTVGTDPNGEWQMYIPQNYAASVTAFGGTKYKETLPNLPDGNYEFILGRYSQDEPGVEVVGTALPPQKTSKISKRIMWGIIIIVIVVSLVLIAKKLTNEPS